MSVPITAPAAGLGKTGILLYGPDGNPLLVSAQDLTAAISVGNLAGPVVGAVLFSQSGAALGTTAQPIVTESGLPAGTDITASASGGNASNVATLAAAAARTTYITGFQCTAGGATVGVDVTVTVAGVVTGTMNYTFTFPVGVAVAATPLIVTFPRPVPASAVDTAIVVTLPAGGTGNTAASVSAQGFQL